MAENKKSFILYCDLIHTVNKLPNEKAGELFKHILSYVNDENPHTEDLIIQIAFEPVKLQLKRDLVKWENYIEKQRQNGKNGGRPTKAKETQKTQAFLEEPKKADNVTVTVTDNVNDTVTNKYKSNFESDYVTDEKVCRENGFDEKQLAKAKFEFWNTKELDAEMLGKTYQDVQKHFLNWCRKNNERIKKLEQGVKQPLPPSSKRKLYD